MWLLLKVDLQRFLLSLTECGCNKDETPVKQVCFVFVTTVISTISNGNGTANLCLWPLCILQAAKKNPKTHKQLKTNIQF